MKRLPMMKPVIFFFGFWSLIQFVVMTPVQAATRTDTFQLKMVDKRWCETNPKFFENITIKISQKDPATNAIFTIKRDPQNTGDLTQVQATIDTKGRSADLDAMTLNGEAFFINKSHNKLELVLSGVNPGNPDHFITMRGQATVDKLSNLTKITGTFFFRDTNTYTTDKKTGAQSGPVECFNNGTFATNQKPAAGSGGGGGNGGGGTLTIADAPASVGGQFVANGQFSSVNINGNQVGMGWGEFNVQTAHAETIALAFDTTNIQAPTLIFAMADNSVGAAWICVAFDTPGYPTCNGVAIDRAAGTVTFTDQVLLDNVTSKPSITLNGTLTFKPF